ncbi:MAG: ABC transporter permease, partial [Candidatus Thorarchaeota archaeon]
MNINAITAIYKKTAKEFYRLPYGVFFMLLFPIFFFFMFGIAFGGGNEGVTTFTIGIVNEDIPLGGVYSLADNFTDTLGNITYNNGTQHIFNLHHYADTNTLTEAVKDQSIQLGIVLPENFSYTLLSAQNQSYYLQTGSYLKLIDLGIDPSYIPTSILDTFTANYN